MSRSLKERIRRLQEYASKTEYVTTDECISLYVDCLRGGYVEPSGFFGVTVTSPV